MKSITKAILGAIALSAIPVVGVIPSGFKQNNNSALAQNIQRQTQFQLHLNVEKKVVQKDEQGKEKISWLGLQNQAVVIPQDVLRYTISGQNLSDRPVKNLNINQPIPKNMIYILNSATVNTTKIAKITYSIDGGHNFVEKPTVQVTLPNGKVETRSAPAKAYTHLRWNFSTAVAAKTTVQGSYQVQVR